MVESGRDKFMPVPMQELQVAVNRCVVLGFLLEQYRLSREPVPPLPSVRTDQTPESFAPVSSAPFPPRLVGEHPYIHCLS